MANNSTNRSEQSTMYLLSDEDQHTSNGCSHCRLLSELLNHLQSQLEVLEQRLGEGSPADSDASQREFYTVAEFAELVGKSIYTVREWCRLYRINAEKCDSGHGDSKSWKIPVSELARYRNHGLLAAPRRY